MKLAILAAWAFIGAPIMVAMLIRWHSRKAR